MAGSQSEHYLLGHRSADGLAEIGSRSTTPLPQAPRASPGVDDWTSYAFAHRLGQRRARGGSANLRRAKERSVPLRVG